MFIGRLGAYGPSPHQTAKRMELKEMGQSLRDIAHENARRKFERYRQEELRIAHAAWVKEQSELSRARMKETVDPSDGVETKKDSE